MNGGESPFSRRMVIGLVSVVSLSFLAALLWGVFGPELRSDRSVASDSFSRSAIGHHAFVELLRELEIPVVVSRNNSGAKAGDRALLLIMEPLLLLKRLRSLTLSPPPLLLLLLPLAQVPLLLRTLSLAPTDKQGRQPLLPYQIGSFLGHMRTGLFPRMLCGSPRPVNGNSIFIILIRFSAESSTFPEMLNSKKS